MDRTNGFRFVNALYEEHNKQSTTDGYKSHLCFLIIPNWDTNEGWFDCLFVYPIESSQTEKNKDGIYKGFCFSAVPFSTLRIEETKIGTTDHVSISFSVYELGKGKGKIY